MKADVLLIALIPAIEDALADVYFVHRLYDKARAASIEKISGNIRTVATGGGGGLSNSWMRQLPSLAIIAINDAGHG